MDKMRVANTLALTAGILWVLCSIVILVLPDFSLSVTEWWMHGMDISVMGSWNLDLMNFVLGGIALIVSAWVSGWVFAWSWDFVKKQSK